LVGRFLSIASPGGRRSAVGALAAPVPLAQGVSPPQSQHEHDRWQQEQRHGQGRRRRGRCRSAPLVGDPFDLARKPLLPSVDTFTIRRSRHGASFVLHQRDAGQVAVAGGMYHVMPAGVFQPSSLSLAGLASDFDLWRNVQREYSEEFPGRLDHDGNASTPIDYRAEEPFRSMDAARRSGRVRVWCLGVGLDPLTLWGEILTVAVFDDEVFDELFSGLVVANDEGMVVTLGTPGRPAHGVPFVEELVAQLLGSEPMAPAAVAWLALARRHREGLLVATPGRS
jgi:hypothetical protein